VSKEVCGYCYFSLFLVALLDVRVMKAAVDTVNYHLVGVLQDGRLQAGDQLLAVNGQSLVGVAQET